MPPREIAAFVHEAIGACTRHPGELSDIIGREFDAILHAFGPVGVISATASGSVKQPARDIGPEYVTAVFIFDADEAALAAAVAETFPFGLAHLGELLAFPKR